MVRGVTVGGGNKGPTCTGTSTANPESTGARGAKPSADGRLVAIHALPE
jgi:hypothetical protein